jgi:gliding motility-associated-like protein
MVLGEAPPGFCAGQLHNTQWVGFVAGTENLSFDVSVFNCSLDNDGNGVGEGLQIGVYNTTDCNNYNLVSNCENQVEEGTSATFTNTEPLVPGGIYFLVIDGAFGDICEFSIDVIDGNTTPPMVDQVSPDISAPATACPGGNVDISVAPVAGAGAYYWTLDGMEIATDQVSTITLPDAVGTYTLCVTPYNPCSQGVEGCTTITVEEPEPNVFEEATICEGDTYTEYGQSFTTAGQYVFTVPTNGACPDVVQLDLSVDLIPEVFLEETVCTGYSFQVGDNSYSLPGDYTTVLVGPNGCDSIVYLSLDIRGADEVIALRPEICEGESFWVAGEELTESGIHVYFLESVDGCDSIIDVDLTVHPPDEIVIDTTICTGQSYSFNGTNYTAPGQYTATFTNQVGCDSMVTVNLAVNSTVFTQIDREICAGQTVSFGGNEYSASGYYETTLTTATGCDSVVGLNLSIVDNLLQVEEVTICAGETYPVGGTAYGASGTYSADFTSSAGCDSTYQVNLTVLPPIATTITPVICPGGSFSIGGESFSTAGTYEVTLTGAAGCDSLVTVQLSVEDQRLGYEALTICNGESVTVGSETLTASGLYEFPYTTADGCDSIYQLELTVLDPIASTLNPEICVGSSFAIAGETYTMPGTYTLTLESELGCDSLITINLTTLDALVTPLSETICAGDTAYIASTPYTTTGEYEESFVTPEGCDSIVRLSLTVLPVAEATIDPVICSGQSYSIGGQSFAAAGQYAVTLTSIAGCDSLVTVNLTVDPPLVETESLTICAGDTVYVADEFYTTTGTYETAYVTAEGCDSLYRLNLEVLPVLTTTVTPVICEGQVFSMAGQEYDQTGSYLVPLTASTGCDSLVTIDLTVTPTTYATIDPLICDGESFSLGSGVYTTTGQYQEVLTSAAGCDSMVTINLTVAPTPSTPLAITICEGESYTVGNETFAADGQYTIVLSTTEGCDSTILLDLTITEFYQTQLTEVLCAGESYTLGTTAYSTTGRYQETFTAADGCDSIVTLDLQVDPLLSTSITASICAGEVYSIGGVDYGSTGVHRETVPSLLTGCDSTITLDLTVLPTYDLLVEETICAGESVNIGDSTYTQSGVYPTLLQTAAGCDSLVHLALTVIPLPETLLTETICAGETYAVGTSTYAATGTYTDVLTSVASGCDSLVTLDLTVLPIVETPLTIAICDGESYTVGTEVFTESGNYTTILTSSQTGCDSIVQLDLVVHPVYETTVTEAICTDETVEVGGESFHTTGIYEVLLSSVDGCDSLVILDLYVAPCALTAEATPKAVNCFDGTDGEIRFALTIGTPPYTYTWERPDGSIGGDGGIPQNGQDITLTGLTAGEYTIQVVDANGVSLTFFSTVEQPTAISLTMESAQYGAYNTSCFEAQDGSLRVSGSGGTPPYSYLWSSGTTGESASGLSAGSYTVTVTDANGCTATLAASLQAPPPLQAGTSVTDPACFEDRFGSLTVENPSGGTPPYRYAIDGGTFRGSPLFANLAVGDHEVTVQDANGCEWREEVRVHAPPELTVDLGADISMDLGDTLRLEALTSQSVLSYEWSGGPLLGCAGPDSLNCYDPRLAPQESTAYAVRVTDANGCTAEDRIQVFVAKKRKVFIPNAFSPNGDGVNDLFTIYAGNDVARIKSFSVFNRWGESVHQVFDFTPNDPDYGWTGRYRGQPLNAGVFVYYVEIEFIDGEIILYKGDVVLMR